ncbi:hypothetical protein IC575_029414 [Cucumis melo]
MNPSTKSQNFSDFDPCDNRHDMVEVVVENNVIPPPPDSQDPCNTQCNTTTEEGKEKQDGRGCGDEMVKWMVKSAINTSLRHSALNGDWKTAESIIKKYSLKLSDPITRNEETILHISAATEHIDFVKKLIGKMRPDELSLKNKNGHTALCFAAEEGSERIAKLLVEKNENLPLIRGDENITPLYIAVSYRREKMASYLLSVTKLNQLNDEEKTLLLIAAIHSDFYGVGLNILKENPKLATMRNGKNNDETALHVLARKPSEIFRSRREINFWKKCISYGTCNKDDAKTLARQLVSSLWEHVLRDLDEKETLAFIKHPTGLLHDAARAGNVEFLILLIGSYPDIVWEEDDDKKSIFHIAVENRLENVFNLIHEISGPRDFSTRYTTTTKGNYNMLHLAAKLPALNHLNRVSGPALQMQRELLWFKEVEKIVLPCQLEAKCNDGSIQLTPRELFTEEHAELRKHGEEWMKNTANSCMLVATLIATVVFAAAFTVPGGNDDKTGDPTLQTKSWFAVFVISDAVALLSSSTSILMFLSILTSRYGEDDFLKSLPSKLLSGLVLLFISIVCMVVAFSATFFLLYRDPSNIWLPMTIATMAIIPVSCFWGLQFKLSIDTFHNTYLFRSIFKPRRRKLSSLFTSEIVDYYRERKKKM